MTGVKKRITDCDVGTTGGKCFMVAFCRICAHIIQNQNVGGHQNHKEHQSHQARIGNDKKANFVYQCRLVSTKDMHHGNSDLFHWGHRKVKQSQEERDQENEEVPLHTML